MPIIYLNNTSNVQEPWFMEKDDYLFPQNTRLMWKIREHLFSGNSPHQKIDFFQTFDHEILFALDDILMLTSKDEFCYHEMLIHPLLCSHPNPEKILIVGGGDCYALHEVLKHPRVKNVDICEIDAMVIDQCKNFFWHTTPSLNDPRTNLILENAFVFLQQTQNQYDIIIGDCNDPAEENPSAQLFSKQFFQLVHKALKPLGMTNIQFGSPFYNLPEMNAMKSCLQSIFPDVGIYTTTCPSFPGGLWGFLVASKGINVRHNLNATHIPKGLKYYNQNIHSVAFELPTYCQNKKITSSYAK